MLLKNHISESGKRKIQLYTAAMYLYAKGKSHPQIINILGEIEPDGKLLTSMVDKAMHDEWDKLYEETRILFSEGMSYDEVLKIISKKEKDEEIATWICVEWYKIKAFYAECVIDGSTNRFEGMKWIIICVIAVSFFFYIGSSWITKSIWIIALIFSILQWIVGMQQRDIAKTIDRIFQAEI